jgi:ribonucleoside-diphosphate reductase alpha chain
LIDGILFPQSAKKEIRSFCLRVDGKKPTMNQETLPLPPETLAAFDNDSLRARIFYEKYALRDGENEPVEKIPEQMWKRLARGLASVERPEIRAEWERKFLWLLSGFRFVPGGRILHAIGNPNKVTASNCYVIPSPDDSLSGIYTTALELAETFKRGGGCGVDISTLRPKDSPAHNAARVSTGAVSFMELYSLTTGIIGQQGRRGALMITISDSHPDVLDFCQLKRNRTSVRYANISVRVTDDFMRAVRKDSEWLLHYESPKDKIDVKRTIHAKDLWREIITGARDFAEPGCLFWSTIQRYSLSDKYQGGRVISTNPCSEHPLEPYGNCNLASLNLAAFISDPFTPSAALNLCCVEKATRYAIRFLDNVLTWNEGRHPLQGQEEAALRGRRIGVGVMGLADMLCQLQLKYDSDEGIECVDKMLEKIKLWAYDESTRLANEKGPFPVFDAEKHLENPFFKDLPPQLIEKIEKEGLRNVTLLTIPPTGSIAAMAGVTSGIEPIFDLKYVRRSESLSECVFEVEHPLVAKYKQMEIKPDPRGDLLPAYFLTAHAIDPEKRILMQAVLQKHIDQAISSTINLPKDTSFETIQRIYYVAWEKGLKGITVYREGSREGILLTEKQAKEEAVNIVPAQVTPRPVTLNGVTARETTPLGTAFVTINYANGNPKEPFEVFVRLGKAGSDLEADAEAIGRLLSLIMRLPSPMTREKRLREVIDQLEHIGGSRSTGFGTERVRSMPDGIARALSRWLETVGSQAENLSLRVEENAISSNGNVHHAATTGDFCPRCRQASLITQQGCLRCSECGYKEC